MTHPYSPKTNPPETNWVPGATSSQPHSYYDFESGQGSYLAPPGPPPSDTPQDLHSDSNNKAFFDMVDFLLNDEPTPPPSDDLTFTLEEITTLIDEIKIVVSQFSNTAQGLSDDQQRTLQQMVNMCQDEAKLTDMCAYNALCACYERGLPDDIEQQIKRQPWVQRGKQGSDKYKSFLRDFPQISENIRESLQNLATLEQSHYLQVAKDNMEENGLGHLTSDLPSAYFAHNPASPQRRPSARTANRDHLSPMNFTSFPDQEQEAGFAWDGSHGDEEERSQKRAKGMTAVPQSKGKEPYTSPTKQTSSPRRAQTPPDMVHMGSSNSDPSQFGTPGKRPRSADSEPTNTPQTRSNNSRGKGAAKKPKPRNNPWRLNVVEGNQLIPQGSLNRYDEVKYQTAVKFLGTEHPLSYYVNLEARLDHMIGVFKRHREKGAGQFHVKVGRCESDDDDEPPGCGSSCISRPKPKNCYIKFHSDMYCFSGRSSIQTYQEAFKTPEFFFMCLARALTKILSHYCHENKISEPVFYPDYIEQALLTYVGNHLAPQDGELPHLAKTLGIGAQEVQRRLIMLRCKQINQYDLQKELTDAQIIGTKREQQLHPPQTFPGDKAFHKLSPKFTNAITRWLINNKDKLTPQNRFPDEKTAETWMDILEEEHPELISHFNKNLIQEYCIKYQSKHYQKFPLLPQPNTNFTLEEQEAPSS
ncbi:unnamed protein product [Calypogeia fissa]